VSSKSGSADFYESLGVPTGLDPDQAAAAIDEEGFAFLFAPKFHGAMRHAAPVRKALGIKTIMNCLGPLANPAGAAYQLIGVFDDALLPVMARAARMLGVRRVWTVRSTDGLDEISPSAPTRIFRIDEKGEEKEEIFDPASLGITGYSVTDLAGGDAGENAAMARELLRGGGPPAVREAVCLNAGAALAVAGVAADLEEGYGVAKKTLESGAVSEKVEALRKRGGAS
jgi:anthranilate synthase/phosphoribosyltransferase